MKRSSAMAWSLLAPLLAPMLAACPRSADDHRVDTAVATAPPRAPAIAPLLERIDPPAKPGAMGPELAIVNGDLVATWLEPIDDGAHRLQFARRGAKGWSAPVTVAEGPLLVANWADFPSVVRGGDGSLVAHFAEAPSPKAYSYDVQLARSTDGGTSWQRIGPANDDRTPTEHGFVSLLAEGSTTRAFWLDGRATGGGSHGHGAGSMTLRTAAVGATATSGAVLDARVCDCCGTAAATTAEGPIVVYRDRLEDEVRDISIIRHVGDQWTPPRPVHLDGWRIPGCPVNGPAVAARDRLVVVAWYTASDNRSVVRAAFSTDAGATFGAAIDVDVPRGRRTPLGRVDVVLEDSGDALVTWMASDREAASVFVRRVARDGRRGAELSILPTRPDRAAGFPRLLSLGSQLALAWTEVGKPSRVHAALLDPARIPEVGRPEAPGSLAAAQPTGLALGSPLPALSVRTLDGASVTTSSLRGDVVLLNLWASWCEPCRQELPSLEALHQRLGKRGLRVVGVSVDRERTAEELRALTEGALTFPIWHDPDDQTSRAFGVDLLPATFLFDRKGALVWQRSGAIAARDPELAAALERVLRKR